VTRLTPAIRDKGVPVLVRKGLVEAFVLKDGSVMPGKGYLWRQAR
jgi:hypothetical protein